MAINTTGLPQIAGPRTLVSGGPPIVLGNEVRGGIHRISGASGDQLNNIDARILQVGMLVYDEDQDTYYMYKNQDGPEPTGILTLTILIVELMVVSLMTSTLLGMATVIG